MSSLIVQSINIADALLIQSVLREDPRGFFCRAYCKNELSNIGLKKEFVQCNYSHNPKPFTLRGLHIQKRPHSEGKLVRCVQGCVYDVIIDIRKDSPTFKNIFGVKLKASEQNSLYAPPGTLHGFITLEENSSVYYMVTENYCPGGEISVNPMARDVDINWFTNQAIMSDKDANGLNLEDAIEEYNND